MRQLASVALVLLAFAGCDSGPRDEAGRTESAFGGTSREIEGPGGDSAAALPHPALDGLEPELAAELGRRRSEVEAALADDAVSQVQRAGKVGRLGQVYQAHRLLEVAEACYRLAHSLDSDSFTWAYYLGVLAASSGKSAEATGAFGRALELRPGDLPTLVRLADIELDNGHIDRAEELYRRAATLDPAHAAATYGLGRVALERRQYEVAVEQLARTLEMQPDATVIHYQLGQAYRQLGDLEAAQRHLARSGKARVAMADPLMHELTTLALGASPHVSLGTALLREGRVPEALDELRRAVDANPENAEAHHRLASVMVRMGDLEAALSHFREVARLRSGSAQAEADVAAVLGELGENKRALDHLLRAVELEPELEQAQFNLANTLARLGRFDEAAARYRRVLELDPDHPQARARLAMTLAQSGELGEATRELRDVVARSPGDARARMNLGVALAESGDLPGAIAEHQAALGLEVPAGMLVQIHLNLGAFKERTGEFEEAAYHYGRANSSQPTNTQAWSRQVALLLRLERSSEALSVLERRVQARAEDGRAVQILARMLAAAPDRSLRDGERALQLATALFETTPAPPHAETLAMALAEQGRFEEAAQLQSSLLAEAERLERLGDAQRLGRNLTLYESGRSCCASAADLLPPQ